MAAIERDIRQYQGMLAGAPSSERQLLLANILELRREKNGAMCARAPQPCQNMVHCVSDRSVVHQRPWWVMLIACFRGGWGGRGWWGGSPFF